MKKIRQYQIANLADIQPSTLSEIINRNSRPSWDVAKKLTSIVPGSTIELWMEGPSETLRYLIQNMQEVEQ
jgi:plasmid maintenance system antidote protein VapI